MRLLNYWPSREEVHNCIKSEAENASDEVLLAVHQQFPLSYMEVGHDGRVMPESKSVATEDDLLQYFIRDAPSGSHVVPITGASGVGKSHLVRILDARLRCLPDAHRYLVIRIPKSASLRRVVQLILEADPLKDNKYDQVKLAFTEALEDVPLDEAVIRFQGQLEISLNDYALKLRERYQRDPADASVREKIGHAEKLPMLISDVETVNHFRLNVLPRIIQRSVRGVDFDKNEAQEIDSTRAQFNVEDLDLSGIDFGQASTKVAKYYRLALEARDGRGKGIAVEILNEVLDPATRQLYQLNQSLGGMTLGDVILEIRRLLLADNRDLVLLVEDFAALVGIQDTLAKVIIQEGATSKGKEYATIRSAIAVTDGYLAGKDTLATRARREWVVESRFGSEDEALRRTKLLVASYINAARVGESALKQYYQKKFEETGSDDKRWVAPVFLGSDDEEDTKALDAFGYVDKVPLFPFTEPAIECLARSALKSGNALVFTPRFVINNVIREVLLLGRESYVNNQFPPSELTAQGPNTDIAQWLASLPISDDQRKRYERLVTIWGNDPKNRSEIGYIPKEIFEIFGLPQPGIDYVKPSPKPATPGDNVVIGKREPETESRQEQQINEFQSALENWVKNGTTLKQGVAKSIRKALAVLINRHIDWNAERCVKRELQPSQFSIPNSIGEGNIATDAIKIAPNSDDPDGKLRGDLMSLLRYFEVYDSSSEYEGIDDDLARIANLADRLLPTSLEMIRSSLRKQSHSAICALAANSRLLGLNERGRTPGAVSVFLFGEVEGTETLPDTAPSQFRDWRALQAVAVQVRPQLRKLLVASNGCFQGTGNDPKVYGVDIVRLLGNYPDINARIELSDLGGITPELRSSMSSMADVRVLARIKQLVKEAKRIQTSIINAFGVDFETQVVVSTFNGLTDILRSMGLWNKNEIEISPNGFVDLCEGFRSSAIKKALSSLQGIEEEIDAKQIARVAQIPLQPLIVTEHFLNYAEKVIRASELHAQTLEAQYQGVNPIEKAKEILQTFEHIVTDLKTLQSGDLR